MNETVAKRPGSRRSSSVERRHAESRAFLNAFFPQLTDRSALDMQVDSNVTPPRDADAAQVPQQRQQHTFPEPGHLSPPVPAKAPFDDPSSGHGLRDMSKSPVATTYSQELLAHDVHRLTKSLRKILLQRTRYAHEVEAMMNCRNYLRESTTAFMDAANKVFLPGPASEGPTHMDLLKKTHASFLEDHESAQRQQEKLSGLGYRISRMEFRLEQKEGKLIKGLESLGHVLSPSHSVPSSGSLSDSERHNDVPVVPNIPLILAQYFDRKGDVGIFQERLQDLDSYHEEGQLTRDMLTERGDDLDVPDDQFRSEYLERRREILQDLESAEVDAEQLRTRCVELGYPTVPHNASKSSDAGDSMYGTEIGDILPTPGSPMIPLFEQPAPNIEGWLQDLMPGPTTLSLNTPLPQPTILFDASPGQPFKPSRLGKNPPKRRRTIALDVATTELQDAFPTFQSPPPWQGVGTKAPRRSSSEPALRSSTSTSAPLNEAVALFDPGGTRGSGERLMAVSGTGELAERPTSSQPRDAN